jgi:hypothetical protein
LSILGTWTGDKNEIWSATRSSLLQAFVSIQGLVLVKEPYVILFPKKTKQTIYLFEFHRLFRWFCEPAYEKLRGTEEGTVNRSILVLYAYRWLIWLTDFPPVDYIVKKPMFFPVDSSAVRSKFRWADSNPRLCISFTPRSGFTKSCKTLKG